MQEHSDIHDSSLPGSVGSPEVQPEAAQPKDLSSYTVRIYWRGSLPKIYENLIYSKWLRSFRFGNDTVKLMDPVAYYPAYSKLINRILDHPAVEVRIAYLTDDHDVVLGFSVARGSILDYVYVHRDQRRQGIGTRLVPKQIDVFTHLTKTGHILWSDKYPTWTFNPFV